MISKEKVGDMIKETNICDVCGKEHTYEISKLSSNRDSPVWFDVEVGIGNRECLPRVNACGVKCVTKVLPKQTEEALSHFAKNEELGHVRIEIRKRQLPSE